MSKPKTRLIGTNGIDMARCDLLIASETLEALAGNSCSGGDKTGDWTQKTSAQRAKAIASALQDIAKAQAILTEALTGQMVGL